VETTEENSMKRVINRVVRRPEFDRKIRAREWSVVAALVDGVTRVKVRRTGNVLTIRVK
jgi:hypothetical protein